MLSETVSATADALARELPALVTCPVCGRTEDGEHMEAVEVEVGEFTEVDVSDLRAQYPGLGRSYARMVKLEWRCRRCRETEPAAEAVH